MIKHIFCNSSDISWCAKTDLYKCDDCKEYINGSDELISIGSILVLDNSDVISNARESV